MLHPNPYINIYSNNGSEITVDNAHPSPALVQVYNLQGQLLYTATIAARSSEMLGTGKLVAGIYLVKATAGAETTVEKLKIGN